MLNTAFELYNKLLNIYKTQYDKLTQAQKKSIKVQNVPENLHSDLCLDEDEDDLSSMPPLEGDEQNVKLEPENTIAERVKLNPRERKNEGAGLKILIPNNLLTRLPILLAQIKAGNNSYKLKNEIRQILSFLYQHNKITKKVCNIEENHRRKYDCNKRSQNFLFDWAIFWLDKFLLDKICS